MAELKRILNVRVENQVGGNRYSNGDGAVVARVEDAAQRAESSAVRSEAAAVRAEEAAAGGGGGGADGKSAYQLAVDAGFVGTEGQWLASLKGSPGNNGTNGREVEFSVSATHIRRRYVGDANWTDLIALAELKGDPGEPGQDGTGGSVPDGGTTGQVLAKTSNENGDAEWVDQPQATPITDSLTTLQGSDVLIVLRDDAPYMVTLSSLAAFLGSSPPTETSPVAFTVGQWTATAGTEQIAVDITALPADGGSAITALQYRLDGGSWVNFVGTGTGVRNISGLAAQAYAVQIRAVNAIGNGPASDTKTRTPTSSGGSAGELTYGNNSNDDGEMLIGDFGDHGWYFTPSGYEVMNVDNKKDPVSERRSTMLSPSLTGIPTGATITSVTMEVVVEGRWMTPRLGISQVLRAVVVDQTAQTPNIDNYAPGQAWAGQHASGSGDQGARLSQTGDVTANGPLTLPSSTALVAVVQAWANGSRAAPLWFVLDPNDGGPALGLYGKEAASVPDGNRPRFRVAYTA